MSETRPMDRAGHIFEIVVVRVMQILLMIMTATAVVVLVQLTWTYFHGAISNIESTEELHKAVQRGFAGVLIILLGLELLDTLKTYFTEHRIGAEVILVVALIAVGRHVIQVDFEHTAGPVLFGLSALLLSLSIGLFLMKKAGIEPAKPPHEAAD